MIPPDLRAEIRRLFFAEHWKVGTIAEQLHVHYYAVKRAIESERFVRAGMQVRPSCLDPYKAFIGDVLGQYPRLRATRLYEMAKERGYKGSAVQLRRCVRTVRPAAKAEVEGYVRGVGVDIERVYPIATV